MDGIARPAGFVPRGRMQHIYANVGIFTVLLSYDNGSYSNPGYYQWSAIALDSLRRARGVRSKRLSYTVPAFLLHTLLVIQLLTCSLSSICFTGCLTGSMMMVSGWSASFTASGVCTLA